MSPKHPLQQTLLAILLDVDALCKAHHIPYFLGEGTLLGAVRHGGFIPWDDDVDIVMKRADYERFLTIAPQALAKKYEVQHSTTVKDFWSPVTKVRLLEHDGRFVQQHISHLTAHNGPYLDIFPMEYIKRKSGVLVRLQSVQIRRLRGMLSLKLGLFSAKTAPQKLLKLLSHFYNVDKIHAKLDVAFKRQGPKPTPLLATFSSYHPFACQVVDSSVYQEAIYIDFEGYALPIPIGYHELLSTIYGDYMTLPPIDKRQASHYFIWHEPSSGDVMISKAKN